MIDVDIKEYLRQFNGLSIQLHQIQKDRVRFDLNDRDIMKSCKYWLDRYLDLKKKFRW